MIANVVRGRGFAGLTRYLESDKEGREQSRIAWSETRNLPSDHPRDAALMMHATAAANFGVKRPVYHLSLSWDPTDRVDRERIVAVADRVLRELGLEKHQVLMVAHADTRHAHVHLMINRVHPETGRAWTGWRDFHALQRSLQAIEREMGFREVPGRRIRLPGQEPPALSPALSTGALRTWQRTGEVPFAELVREVAGRDFVDARSWADLEARLARKGLRVETRRRGMVVTDGTELMKCSAVVPEASRAQLERRFGERYADHARERGASREAAGRGIGDAAVERVRRQVVELERTPAQHSPQYTLGHALLRLAPQQLRALHQSLTSPQRALAAQALRAAKAFLLEQERER